MNSALPDIVYLICKMVGGFVAGMSCGMIPYCFGKQRQQATLALAGLMVCTLSGVVSGLILALPMAGVFCGAIALQPQPKQTLLRLRDDTEDDLSLELCEG